MTLSFAHLLFRLKYPVLLGVAALVILAAQGLTRLELSSDLESFFHENDPDLLAYDAIRDTYTRDDNLFFVFVPPNGENVFTPDNLATLEEITAASWSIPHALRVDSVTNFQHTEAAGDDLLVAPLVENARQLSAAQIAKAKRIATTEPLLLGRLVTTDGDLTAINITVQLPAGQRAKAIPEAVRAARALRADIEARHPGSRLLITGKVAGNNAFTEASVYDLTHIVPVALLIALACIAGYLYIASGSILTALGATCATILVILASVICGMGAAGWLGIAITPPMANAPTVILTLAVADCMHLLVTYFQARRRGDGREAAMAHSLRLNFQAVLLTSVTTVIGFLALNFSDAQPFHDLGNTVAIGIAGAWLFSISLLPVLMVIFPGRVYADADQRIGAMARIADRVIARPRLIFFTTLTLIILATACLPRNQLYDVWAEYFDESTQIRQDSDFARAALNGFNTLEFNAGAGESGAVVDPDYLRTLEAFAQWLGAQPEVAHVSVFTEVMKRLNRNLHGDDPAWHRLPADRELAAQYLLLYEFSLPFGLDLTNQVNLDKSATRVIAGLHTSSTRELIGLQERAKDWQRKNAPASFYHPGASSDAMFAHMGKRNVKSMLLGSFIGLIAISLVIGLALRSLSFGLVSLLLNLLPMLVGFGLWGLLVGRVGLGLSVVSGLTMGIVVDYTVHLLSKYKLGQEEHQLDTADAIRYAFSTVGVALVVTTIVLCVNFGLLAVSVFALNSELGILTAGIILIALLIDFLFLPPLLLWLGRRKDRRASVLPASGGAPLSPATSAGTG